MQGRKGSLKSELKETGGGESSLFVSSLCEKKLPDFQTVGRVLSDMLLGSY